MDGCVRGWVGMCALDFRVRSLLTETKDRKTDRSRLLLVCACLLFARLRAGLYQSVMTDLSTGDRRPTMPLSCHTTRSKRWPR